MCKESYLTEVQLKALPMPCVPAGLVSVHLELWGCNTTVLLHFWDGSERFCWCNTECGSAVMVGDTVKTRQTVL